MTLLTIIIPHYNNPKTLEKLIHSIPDRNEIQTIVVDDNSDQHPGNFLSNPLLKRILLLENKSGNKGAGACRNIGLEQAEGDWVLFADSDDYFVNGFFPIVSQYFSSDYEVVFFKSTSVNLITGEKDIRHLHINNILDDCLEKANEKSTLRLRYLAISPIAKLIRRDFIENNSIRFDEVIATNDVMFSTKVGYFMENFKVSDEVIYCISRSEENLTMNMSEELFDVRVDVFIQRCHFLKQHLEAQKLGKLDIFGWIYVVNPIRFSLGIKKAIYTWNRFRQNGVPIIDIRLLNPIHFIKELHAFILRWRYKRNYYRISD